MRELIFTAYQNKDSKWGSIKIKTWEDWILSLNTHEIRGSLKDSNNKDSLFKNKNGPAVVLGEVPKSKRRINENIVAAHAIALDLDKHPESAIEILLQELSHFEFFLYTTHKHGSAIVEYPRLRVIFPLKEPIPNAEYSKYWLAFDNMTHHMNDPQTKNISRLHFFPSTFDMSAKPFNYHNPGRWLSMADLDAHTQTSLPLPDIVIEHNLDPIRNKLSILKHADPLKPIAKAVLAGESFAPEGERHKPILDITMWLARKDQKLTTTHLEELFRASLSKMPSKDDLLKEIQTAYQGFVEKLKNAKPQINKDTYTQQELEHIAKRQNCTIPELKNRWVIQTGGGGWVLMKDGNYTPLQEKSDIVSTIKKHLDKAPIELFRVNPETGRTSFKQLSEIVYEYGDVSFKNIADMNAQCSYFIPEEKTMIEAVCPRRPNLVPKQDPEIDTFLKKLFGVHYEKGLDWLVGATMLEEIICAIYINGPKGCGKTMLINGLAGIWSTTSTPTKLDEFLSNFNEIIKECPVVFADEKMPHTFKGDSITAQLRAMLSITSRPLTRKHKTTSNIIGGVRLALAANNDTLLDTNEIYTFSDIEAIAERFWYLEIRNKDSVKFLEALPREKKKQWVSKGIAEHVLWLVENRGIKKPGTRFIVEGNPTEMHQLLRTGTPFNSLVCEWLIKWLENHQVFDGTPYEGLARIHKKQFLVNARIVVDMWDKFIKNKRYEPTTKIVGTALKSLSDEDTKPVNNKGKTVRYHVIHPESLVAWSNRYGVGDPDLIMNRINEVPVIDPNKIPIEDENQTNVWDAIESNDSDEKEGY